jgi:hypothetical protein
MRRRWRVLPRLVRFLILNGLLGFAASAVLVAALLAGDPGNARRLLLEGAGHWWPALLLWLFSGLTFGAVQIGAALALLGHDDAAPRPGVLRPVLLLARVRSR